VWPIVWIWIKLCFCRLFSDVSERKYESVEVRCENVKVTRARITFTTCKTFGDVVQPMRPA